MLDKDCDTCYNSIVSERENFRLRLFIYLNKRFMTTQDWINIARCNQKRMIEDLSYTLCFTSQHDRFLEIWSTTIAALKLAQRASKLNVA